MPGTSGYVLLQFGSNPFDTRFEDLDGRLAFTVKEVEEQPNLLVKLTREAPWSQQHSDIMGPSAAFFYFGPSRSPGYIVYGNSASNPMLNSIRQRREGSTSRYFTAQSGKEYKWRFSNHHMECVDGRTTIASYDMQQRPVEFFARLIIKDAGLPVVTEILTTLCLNRMAQGLAW